MALNGNARDSAKDYCLILDPSMSGLEGAVRIYTDICPSITARIHKDPQMVLRIRRSDYAENPEAGKLIWL